MKNKITNRLLVVLISLYPITNYAQNWPKAPNAYSWEGTWNPVLPIPNMYDDYYFDGHEQNGTPTPVLPPGIWDWETEHNLANWKNYQKNIGHFAAILDNQNRIYGWKIILDHLPAEFTPGAAYFSGSPGSDIVDLGAGSSIHTTEHINLGDGPDILRFEKSWSLFLQTGSTFTGFKNDNDLVIAGRNTVPVDGSHDIGQTSIVTGPGNDLVFVNNMASAGVDAGCGNGGRSDILDPNDGDDIVVYGGNMADFRFLGGKGNDLAVWYADEVQQQAAGWKLLGPNFFGGGAWGKALWDDEGTDRLIMAISPNTVVKNAYGAPQPGQLNVYLLNNYPEAMKVDQPTETSLFGRYCITCGIGPNQKKTVTLEYVSPDGKVFTGRFWLTGMEELQIGIGQGAKVYKLDEVNGKAILDNSLQAIDPPLRSTYNQIATNFIAALNLSDPPPTTGYAPINPPKLSGMEVFPNPAFDQVNIRYIGNKSSYCTISLTDMTGQNVFKKQQHLVPGENYFQVDVAKIEKGIYLVRIDEEGLITQTKLILN